MQRGHAPCGLCALQWAAPRFSELCRPLAVADALAENGMPIYLRVFWEWESSKPFRQGALAQKAVGGPDWRPKKDLSITMVQYSSCGTWGLHRQVETSCFL